MSGYLRTFLVAALVLVPCAACVASEGEQPAETSEAILERGRKYTELFYTGQLDALYLCCAPTLRHGVGMRRLKAVRSNVTSLLGQEHRVLEERIDDRLRAAAGVCTYVRTAEFDKASRPIELWWTLDSENAVLDFYVGPQREPAETEYADYQTKTPLRLPFEGRWLVLWAGRDLVDNPHAADHTQRFAVDFLIAKGGKTHRSDGTRNSHYYCYGQPILAPGGGMVVEAIDGVPDNLPGISNYARPLGNQVTIYHGQGEYSVLAHLQEGSVAVAPQQVVKAGERVGRCGNSGESREPHLHYHLQRGLGSGAGLPAQFLNYLADGKRVERGEPQRGQVVQPQR